MIRSSLPLFLVVLYFFIIHFTMGLRPEHLLLMVFILACYYLHPKSRDFILDFLPFAFFGIIYDFLRIYPKAWAGPIHVVWPYQLEKLLFGFKYGGHTTIPNDFFRFHQSRWLDVITGIAYSLHMVVPVAFAFFVWLRHRMVARQFIRAFLLVNFFAFITYIVLPVAPPWYVEQYGLVAAHWSISASAAGLLGFDRLLGFPYFEKIYGENAWTFGAIPSMHGGYPLLVILFARKFLRRGLIPFVVFMVLVWFSAVYLRHHYIIDLLAGAFYVILAYLLIPLPITSKMSSKTHSS